VLSKDTMEIDTVSYEETYSEVLKAVEWLSNQGFDHSKSRIGFYERAINELLKTYKTESTEKLKAAFPKYGNAIYEIFDLIDIYHGLSKVREDELSDLLRKFLGGPVNYPDENPSTSSNLGRNTAFQLIVAAKLSNANLAPRLEEPSDIGFKFERYHIFVECKRPQKAIKIESSLKDGKHQLKHRLNAKTSPLCAGIIALDITKIKNPDFSLLVKDTPEELKSGLDGITNSFIESNGNLWQKPQKSRILGVLIHFSLMAVVKDRDLLTHCRQLTLNPLEASGLSIKSLSWRLANQLGSSTRERLFI
jgi:hypothetical protein